MKPDRAYAIANSMEDRGELKKGGKHAVEEGELEEISARAAGAVEGHSAPIHNKEEDDLIEKIINYLINK